MKNVKSEFGFVCNQRYKEALSAIKFLSKFHSKKALFEQLKKDTKSKKKIWH